MILRAYRLLMYLSLCGLAAGSVSFGQTSGGGGTGGGGGVSTVTGTAPIQTSVTGSTVTVSCPTCGTSTNGISGLTTGQVPIAGSATTVTSSKALAGAGAGITTGPTSSTAGDVAFFLNTTGQVSDGAIAGSNLATLSGIQTFSGAKTFGTITATTSITDSALTAGQCVQTGTGGLLTVTGSACGAGGGSGTVTSFSAGNLSALFTTSVATATTTPALTFTAAAAAANTVFGNFTAGSAIPTFSATPVFSAATLTNFPTFNQNTTGTAANLSGTPALPNGTTATTQTVGDNTTKLATTAFVIANAGGGSGTVTHTVGALTAQKCVIGNGAADVKVDATCNLDGSGNETLTSVTTLGTTNGAFTATFTGSAATAPTTNQFQISPAIAVTTPWSLSPAAAPATGLLFGTNTSGIVQQSFKSIVGTDAGVASAATISSTAGTAVCSTANGGVTTTGCSGGSGPANVHTATTFTGIGTGASAVTPTHTLDVNGGTDTSVVILPGSSQASNLLSVEDGSGNPYFRIASGGQLETNGGFSIYSGLSTQGLGLPTIVGDTFGANTSRTAAVGTSTTPIVLATATQFGSNNFQSYLATCYMNTKAASTGVGTVSLFLKWTDDVGVKTSAAAVLTTTTLGTFLQVGPTPIVLNATTTATTLGYYTTITGTPTYGIVCHAERID